MIKDAKKNEELKALINISNFAKNPTKGGTPAKLNKANITAKPTNGFEEERKARSTKVLLLFSLDAVLKDKITDQIQKLVNI
jgi:hypothetical protein